MARHDGDVSAAAALQENRDAIRDAGCIPALVCFLEEAESLEAKDKAVGAICNLAYMSPENKVTAAIPAELHSQERVIRPSQQPWVASDLSGAGAAAAML